MGKGKSRIFRIFSFKYHFVKDLDCLFCFIFSLCKLFSFDHEILIPLLNLWVANIEDTVVVKKKFEGLSPHDYARTPEL